MTRMEKWAAKRAEIQKEILRASRKKKLDFINHKGKYGYKHELSD